MRITGDYRINFALLDSLMNVSNDSHFENIDNEALSLNCQRTNQSEDTEFIQLLEDWRDRELASKKRKLTDYPQEEEEIEQIGGNNFFEIQQRSEVVNAKFNSIQFAYKLIFKNLPTNLHELNNILIAAIRAFLSHVRTLTQMTQ